jgi:molecular chaperone DnaJ
VTKRDYYDILGVDRNAGDQEIKSAYRKQALKFHPDRNPGDKAAEESFKEAAEAYAVLADADKRQGYDRFGHAAQSGAAQGGQGFDPSTFTGFEDILGGLGDIFGGGGRRRGGPTRGADLRYDLEISFDESGRGTETSIQIPRQETCKACKGTATAPGTKAKTCPGCNGHGQVRVQQGFFTMASTCARCRGTGRFIASPCPTCRGNGRIESQRKLTVKIPPGIATGQRLRLSQEGESGSAGGPPGDLYVVIHVQDHDFFVRDGNDLHCEVQISFATAALGATIVVPGLFNQQNLNVPEGTQTGTTFRIRNHGMPDVSGRGRGDLLVSVRVRIPTKLTKEQKSLLGQLSKTLPEQSSTPTSRHDQDDRGIFDRVKDIFG